MHEQDRLADGRRRQVDVQALLVASRRRRGVVEVRAVRERIGRVRTILGDRRRTSFVLVTVPERLVIEETARAAGLLSDTGIDVGGLIVNRVLPDGLTGEFYQERKAQESMHLRDIERRFGRLPRVRVRQLPKDAYGIEALKVLGDQLLG